MSTQPPLFDLYLPQVRMSFETILERVLIAEACGFHTVWLMDHLAAPGKADADVLDAWTLAAALAVRTDRIRIGHLVLADALRHPAVLAKQITTVDVISGGRVEWGMGWGSVPDELRRFGVTTADNRVRAARMRGSVRAIRALHTGEPVDLDDDHVQLRGAQQRPTPVQTHVPLTIGGAGLDLTMPLVREFADWWNCPSYATDALGELAGHRGEARISVQRPIGLLLPDANHIREQELAQRRFGRWGGLAVGVPEDVGAALAADRTLGVERFVLQFHDFGTPRTLEHFAATVPSLVA